MVCFVGFNCKVPEPSRGCAQKQRVNVSRGTRSLCASFTAFRKHSTVRGDSARLGTDAQPRGSGTRGYRTGSRNPWGGAPTAAACPPSHGPGRRQVLSPDLPEGRCPSGSATSLSLVTRAPAQQDRHGHLASSEAPYLLLDEEAACRLCLRAGTFRPEP